MYGYSHQNGHGHGHGNGHVNGFRQHDYARQQHDDEDDFVPDSQVEIPEISEPAQNMEKLDADDPDEDSAHFGSQFQATQEASQPRPDPTPSQPAARLTQVPRRERWGLLLPVEGNRNPACTQTVLSSSTPYVLHAVGRAKQWMWEGHRCETDLVISNIKISGTHCKIWRVWDPRVPGSEQHAVIMLEDCSTNGTYIRDEKIGKGKSKILLPFEEFSLGFWGRSTPVNDDFRYQYIPLLANGRPQLRPDPASAGGLHKKYELFQAIGKGSFATVHKAVDRSTGEWRAVKIINNKKFERDAKTLVMLRREVAIMQSAKHRYIVSYIDGFEDSDRLYLVMELVEGGDLLDFITARGGLEEDEASEIALMVCEAISYLHQKGIAHRDLKPENLLLTTDPNPICKVADFGLAKLATDWTHLRTMCGTPSYLAPEVVLQGQEGVGYGFAVDAWSIGVVIYSAIANASPFQENEEVPLHVRMKHRRPDMKLLHDIGCTEECIDFISGFLTLDPARRMTPYDALKHPWLSGCIARRASSGADSMLRPTPPAAHSSSPPQMSQPSRILPQRVQDLSQEDSHADTPVNAPSLAASHSERTDHSRNSLENEDPGNESDAPSCVSYSQKLGNLRIQSEADFGLDEDSLDDLARARLPTEGDARQTKNTPPPSKGRPNALSTTLSLKRKQPASYFSTDSSEDVYTTQASQALDGASRGSSSFFGTTMPPAPTTASTSLEASAMQASAPQPRSRAVSFSSDSSLSDLTSSDCESGTGHCGTEQKSRQKQTSTGVVDPLKKMSPQATRTYKTGRRKGPSPSNSATPVRGTARRKSARASVLHAPSYAESDDEDGATALGNGKAQSGSGRARKQRRVSTLA